MKMASNDSINVDILNQEEVERLWPLLLYIAVIGITGIPGNFVVCIVYRRNPAQSNSQFFMMWLAAIDCFSCCMVFLEIINVVNQYTYQGTWMCKFTIFLELWPSSISVATLCVIGIDRYRKVCNPHGSQISYKMAKRICGFMVLLGLSLSWPPLVLFGVREITIHPYNVTGTTCAILAEFDNTSYLRVFNGLMWIVFVVALTSIIILYSFIGKKVFQHAKHVTGNNVIRGSEYVTEPSGATGQVESTDDGISTDSSLNRKTSLPSPTCSETTTTLNKMSRKSKRRRESRARQSAFIMFLISLVFIISFFPYLILRLVEVLNVGLIYSMSDGTRAVYKFFLRCYFLNCAANPFIYCAFATKFRKDAKGLFVRLFRRCKV